jgi:hypothetical protein
MKLTKSQLREIIKEVLDELDDEVDEATTTGSVDGYMTPHAFSKSDEPDDEYVDRLNKSTGYTRVNESLGDIGKYQIKKTNQYTKENEPGYAPVKYTEYDIFYNRKKVGELEHEDYFGTIEGNLYGKRLPEIGGFARNSRNSNIQTNFFSFLKSKTGQKWASNLHKYGKVEEVNEGRLSKQDSKEANRLYDIVLQKKAGRERTEAVKGLARIARKYSKEPITTMKQVLATLDLVEPDTPGGHLAVRNQKLNEGTNRYQQLRKDERTPNQKIGVGIRELRKQLQEIEKFVTWYGRIKNEAGLEPSDYWKRTQRHLTKISERLNKLSIKVKEMSV